MDRDNKVIFEVGDYISLEKGTTIVTGQCMGFRVGKDGMAEELWIDGFYSGFDLGDSDRDWQVIDSSDGL